MGKLTYSAKASSSSGQKSAIKSKIKQLCKVEKRAFRSRHGRNDFYDYLKAVYNAWEWTDRSISKRVGQLVAHLFKVDLRRNKSPIRVVIDATSNEEDRRVKSRWAQALEYAVEQKVSGKSFKKFLRKNGGVLGCARKMAQLRKKKFH